jgi:hypothetical protein
MYKLTNATPLPKYVLEHKFLKASLLTYLDKSKPGQLTYSNKFSSYDSLELFNKNLKTQPAEWHYRKKEVTYKSNANGYRADEWDSIDWKNAVVIFGCSCTVGVGLAEDETVTEQLSKMLNRPVVNMGVSASSMQFSFINSTLLSKHFPTPYAVVNLWTNIDRFTIFKNQLIDHSGPWDDTAIYKEYASNIYHAMTEASYIAIASRELWKTQCKYYSASFFDQTAHYTESDWVEIDNQARDLVHPGRNSAKQMAELIAKNIS